MKLEFLAADELNLDFGLLVKAIEKAIADNEIIKKAASSSSLDPQRIERIRMYYEGKYDAYYECIQKIKFYMDLDSICTRVVKDWPD